MAIIWLIVAAAFAVGEVVTTALYALFVAAAAAAAAVAAVLGAPVVVQATVFVVALGAGIGTGRRPLMRLARRGQGPALISGADGLVGEQGLVVTAVRGSSPAGQVRIRGEEWPAITADGTVIEPGQSVLVVDRQHSQLVVAPL